MSQIACSVLQASSAIQSVWLITPPTHVLQAISALLELRYQRPTPVQLVIIVREELMMN